MFRPRLFDYFWSGIRFPTGGGGGVMVIDCQMRRSWYLSFIFMFSAGFPSGGADCYGSSGDAAFWAPSGGPIV